MADDLTRLLDANRRAAAGFDGGKLLRRPARPIAVLTCLDARIDPLAMLGLARGDANVLRNAGGRVTDDVIRSLLVSAWLLGTRLFLVIHHTDCGLEATGGDAQIRAAIAAAGGRASGIGFAAFSDLDEGLTEDVTRLSADPRFPADVDVRGGVYEVTTGLIRLIPPIEARSSR